MKKNCVISAVGKNSLHREWIKESSTFDLHLIVYDDSINEFKDDTPFIVQNKGYKFKLVYDYLIGNPLFIDQYTYFFVPDDDISMDSGNIDRLFAYMEEYNICIAQPALSDSYYTYEHTMKSRHSLLRYTNFVEVMVPCFSREALKKTLFTFNENVSGWGIDFHWRELVGFTGIEMAVIDDLHCVHTRPVQSSNAHNFGELDAYILKYNLKREVRELGFVQLPERQLNDVGVQNWIPLYSQPEQQKYIESCLARIAQNLLSNIHQVTSPGLSEGRMGISLFFFNYYRLTGKRKYYDIALAIFESIYDSLCIITDDISLSDGLSGVSWAVEYLAQNGFIEEDTDEVLEDICAVLSKSPLIITLGSITVGFPEGELKSLVSPLSVEMNMTLNELIGYGMHLLLRMRNPNFQPEENTTHLTEKFITFQIIDYLDLLVQKSVLVIVEPTTVTGELQESINFESLVTIILYLSLLKKQNTGHGKIEPLIVEYVELVKQELANNRESEIRGQLILANALLEAAKVTENTEWEQYAIGIALKAIQIEMFRKVKKTIASGPMEIAHLYNRIYQSTLRSEFKEAAKSQIEQVLKQGDGNDIVQELSRANKFGIKGGLAGWGLELIATIADFEPKWDEVLLVSHFCF